MTPVDMLGAQLEIITAIITANGMIAQSSGFKSTMQKSTHGKRKGEKPEIGNTIIYII